PGAYPVVLISYTVACTRYESAEKADAVRELLTYIASEEGQLRAASPDVAGAAPISPALRERVGAAAERISGPEAGSAARHVLGVLRQGVDEHQDVGGDRAVPGALDQGLGHRAGGRRGGGDDDRLVHAEEHALPRGD